MPCILFICILFPSSPFFIQNFSCFSKLMAMDSRPEKIRKLQHLRKAIPYTSKTASEAILKHVKDEGLPELVDRKAMRDANRAIIHQCSGDRPLLQTAELTTHDQKTLEVKFTDLATWIQGAYHMGGGFHELLSRTLAQHPVPHVLLYADEVTPGNVLAPVPSRKTWAIYGSFKEFHTHLQSTNSWITLCVIRSSQMNTVAANMSQLMKVLVHQIISTGQTGIQLVEPKGMPQPMPYKRLYMKIGFWIMDGAAHKFCFSIKGDSGSRFCNLCKNVFVAKTNQDEEEDMEIMEVSSFTKVNQLDLATDTEIWSSWSRMTARKSTKSASAFKKWEQATGITYSSHAILADPSLQEHFQPTSVLFHDWMHALLCNGVMSIAIYKVLQEVNLWSNLAGWLACWNVPSQWKTFNVVSLFQAKRLEKHLKGRSSVG